MYFNGFNDYTRKIWREDKAKHDVITEIIYSTNYQEEYNGLKNRECYFSYKVIEDRCNITHKKALRIMKELEEDGFIKWVYKSNSKGKKSIILLSQIEDKKEPVEEPVKEPVEVSNGKALRGVKEPVEEPVKEPSSINKSKNKSNIYMDLTFIDDVVKIEKVKLTQEEYDTLKAKYGESELHNVIVSLETYIANGKKYINHYFTLNNWLRNNKSKDNIIHLNNREATEPTRRISYADIMNS